MKRQITFLAILFGIPAFGLAAGEGLRRYFEGQFADAARSSGNVHYLSLTLGDSCQRPRFRAAVQDFCDTYDNIVLMRDASLWVAAAALFMILSIWAAARLSRRNRVLLVALFAPGMRLVLWALFGMIIVQGAIAAYGVYIVEAVVAERVHYFLIGGVAIGAVVGAFKMIGAGLSLSKLPSMPALAIEVPRDKQTGLWAFVAGIAERIGAREPQHLILGLEPTFYATAANVALLGQNGSLTGETVYLSLPLMRVLTARELGAVIGHELGHFKGKDTDYSLRFVPIYTGLTRALGSLAQQQGSSALALLPAFAVLGFFLERFATAERTIGRQRELEADRVGASVDGPDALASALVKVSALSPLSQFVRQVMIDALNKGKSLTNASLFFRTHAAAYIENVDKSKLVSEIASSRLSHPTDTHPTLTERMEAFGISLANAPGSLNLDGEPSSSIVVGVEAIEESLTDDQASLLLHLGHATLPEEAAPSPPTGRAAFSP